MKKSSYSFISSLFFVNPCTTEEEFFLGKYHSLKEIEQDIRADLLDKLILNDKSDVSISLQERIEKNLNDILSLDVLRQRMGEAEIFFNGHRAVFHANHGYYSNRVFIQINTFH